MAKIRREDQKIGTRKQQQIKSERGKKKITIIIVINDDDDDDDHHLWANAFAMFWQHEI